MWREYVKHDKRFAGKVFVLQDCSHYCTESEQSQETQLYFRDSQLWFCRFGSKPSRGIESACFHRGNRWIQGFKINDCIEQCGTTCYRWIHWYFGHVWIWRCQGKFRMLRYLIGNGIWLQLITWFFLYPQPSHLEHLCINLCAETMQHFYNTHVFKACIESCRDEGIHCDWEVDYVDNVPCIDLISSLVRF